MVSPANIRNQGVVQLRRGLEKALQVPALRNAARRTAHEITKALEDPSDSGIYGSEYFGADRDPLDRMGLSGYERYDRESSNANVAAYLIWRHLDVESTLDVGCATGFVVEALNEMGVDAHGTDISHYAIDHAAIGAKGRLEWGDLMKGLPYRDGQFDVLTCFEVLEHMEPGSIETVLAELHRVTSRYVVCTIPSFGPNAFGPGGWFQVKVRDELVERYYAKGPEFRGPIDYDDIFRDAKGEPIEGHLCLASFDWWTEQFANAGLQRCGAAELRMHPDLARFGMSKYWNLYVFRRDDVADPVPVLRDMEEINHWESKFGLDGRQADPQDLAAVARALVRNGEEVEVPDAPDMEGAPFF